MEKSGERKLLLEDVVGAAPGVRDMGAVGWGAAGAEIHDRDGMHIFGRKNNSFFDGTRTVKIIWSDFHGVWFYRTDVSINSSWI